MSERSKNFPIIKNLHVNITESAAPLVAGFYLEGPTVAHRKQWHFGDGSEEDGPINNNLLENHEYHKSGDYEMWVDILDVGRKVIESSKKIKFHVKEKLEHVNFSQWEGVIYEGDDVGFLIAHDFHSPIIKWEWNDDTKPDDYSNPHHRYDKEGTFTGTLTVSGEGIEKSRKFAAMVLPNLVKNMVGDIGAYVYGSNQTENLPTGKKLIIEAKPTGGKPPYSCIWKIDGWGEGVGIQIEHTFTKSGGHHVQCTVQDTGVLRITFDKTIVTI